MQKNVCTRACKSCIYHADMSSYKWGCCNYIFIADERRPCPPGKDCTVRVARKRGRKKKVEVANG